MTGVVMTVAAAEREEGARVCWDLLSLAREGGLKGEAGGEEDDVRQSTLLLCVPGEGDIELVLGLGQKMSMWLWN
jgi:hypothetical protein